MKCRRSSEREEEVLHENFWFAGKALARKKTSWLRREKLTGAPRVLEKLERLPRLTPWKR